METNAQLRWEATSRVPQRCEFGPVRFNICINSLEKKGLKKNDKIMVRSACDTEIAWNVMTQNDWMVA